MGNELKKNKVDSLKILGQKELSDCIEGGLLVTCSTYIPSHTLNIHLDPQDLCDSKLGKSTLVAENTKFKSMVLLIVLEFLCESECEFFHYLSSFTNLNVLCVWS